MDAIKGNLRNILFQLGLTIIMSKYNLFKFQDQFLDGKIIDLKYSGILVGAIFISAIFASHFSFPLELEVKQKNKVTGNCESEIVIENTTDNITTPEKQRHVKIIIKLKKNKSIFNFIYYLIIKIFTLNIFIMADGFILTRENSIYMEDCINKGIKIKISDYLVNNVNQLQTRELKLCYVINKDLNLGTDVPVNIRVNFYEDLTSIKNRIINKVIKFFLRFNKKEKYTVRYIRI
ncbi:MAG: hypothetical protein ACRC6U_10305 [Fusobacteriaceae bacterium]